ncbi:helix-turn-helix domain-containing protein, partial [Acinetobacter ursingii]
LGGIKGGRVRSAKYDELRMKAKDLHLNGLSCRKIATELGVSKSVVATWIKCPSEPKSDISAFERSYNLLC